MVALLWHTIILNVNIRNCFHVEITFLEEGPNIQQEMKD